MPLMEPEGGGVRGPLVEPEGGGHERPRQWILRGGS